MNTRYIVCTVKGSSRTEILDTTIDGGEGEPLIVASFFDHAVAVKFCRAANAAPVMHAALKEWVDYFDQLNRDAEPGDPLINARTRFHGRRMSNSRDALALGGDL